MRNKKIIQRFIAFVIVGTSLLTSFSACKLNGDPSNVNNDEMRETAEFIVKDGKTDYKIVMDSNPSPDEEFAKSELLALLILCVLCSFSHLLILLLVISFYFS